MKVLIAGCGYLGIPLGRQLGAEGHEVYGLRRNPDALPEPIRPVAADLADAATLDGLPRDIDAIVYAPAGGGKGEDKYRRLFIQGPRNLLRAVQSTRPPRVVMVSSTGVYAQQDGEWIDESSPTEPSYPAGLCMLEGEAIFLNENPDSTVIRLAGIYGPERTRLIRAVRENNATFSSGAEQILNQIHRDDCVGAIRHLLFKEQPEPVYIGVDSEPAPRERVLRWLVERLDGSPPVAVPPDQLPERQRRSNKRCSNQKLLDSGYHFVFPTWREGYSSLIASS